MITLRVILGRTVAALVLITAGTLIGRYELLPISAWADAVNDVRRSVSDYLHGTEDRVARVWNRSHPRGSVDAGASIPPRDLDTSVLPLRMTTFSLTGTGLFADSDVAGAGALANVEGQLVAMDSLGDFFTVRENTLTRLAFGPVPNGAKDLIRQTTEPVPLYRARALYLAYDQVRGTLYASLKRFDASSQHTRFNISAISLNKLTLDATSNWRTVFESEDIPDEAGRRGANGGRLIVVGDTLYFTTGDFGWGQVPRTPFEFTAQDASSSFGKICAVDIATGAVRVHSTGHRNPQGLVWTTTGRLLETEQGPEGGDELNVIERGRNYGWPYQTYGTDYGTFGWPARPGTGTFTGPLFAWVPSVAVSPIVQVTGFSSRWDGDLLAGSLKSRSLFRLRMRDDHVVFSEPIWIGHRIRDIVQVRDQIVLMADDPALLTLRIDDVRLKQNSKMAKDNEFPSLAKCMACHHFGDTNPSHLAPTLTNLIGKKIGSDSFLRYSDALRSKGGVWDEKSLAAFIRNPAAFAPGSAMPSLPQSDSDIRQILADLRPRR